MKRALIDINKCRNCSECEIEKKCQMKAVFRESCQDKPWVDFYRCSGCMKCKIYCDYGSIIEEAQPCSGRARISW